MITDKFKDSITNISEKIGLGLSKEKIYSLFSLVREDEVKNVYFEVVNRNGEVFIDLGFIALKGFYNLSIKSSTSWCTYVPYSKIRKVQAAYIDNSKFSVYIKVEQVDKVDVVFVSNENTVTLLKEFYSALISRM